MAKAEDLFLPLCAPFVLTALEGEELSNFERHVKGGCARCAEEIIELAKVAALLAAAVPQVPVSPDLKERILFAARLASFAKEQIDTSSTHDATEDVLQLPPDQPARSRRRWLAMGSILVGLLLVTGAGLFVRSLLTSIDEHESYIKTLQRHITQLKNEADSREAILRGIESRRVDIVTLDGSAVNPFGFGKIIWDLETKGAIVQASNLPPAADGAVYQLWAMRGEKQLNAGLLELLNRHEQESYYRVPPIEVGELREIGGFTITLEPNGGSAQPTGVVYLLGKPSPKESLPIPKGNAGAP